MQWFESAGASHRVAANVGCTVAMAQEHLDAVMTARQGVLTTAADLLIKVVKFEKLLQLDKDKLNEWARVGDGRSMWVWLITMTTLTEGKAQDKRYRRTPQ